MIKKISVKELDTWKSNFKDEPGASLDTSSAVVSLDILKKFIADLEKTCPDANGIRIYFVRYPLEKDMSYIVKAKKGNVSQVSLALVPTTSSNGESGGEDYPVPGETSKIIALSVCQPSGENWDPSTGLCPPKCNW